MSQAKRILIVGGVAGGASCAARLRRLDEQAAITIFERGPYVSFANCGLPYHVGDVIQDERKLLVASEELFRRRFAIAVHSRHEVIAIDRQAKCITVQDLAAGTIATHPYDALVLSPGAAAVRPPIPGLDLPGIFTMRTIPDARQVREWITARKARAAVVIGAGFIGLEMAENLALRGLHVTVVEKASQVLPPLDPEMAALVQERLAAKGVQVVLAEGVAAFAATSDGRLEVTTERGSQVQADLVILAMGVRPETRLAREAGLALGKRGGIAVDASMRSSDPCIWAVGDAVEVVDAVTGEPALVPLAGPANRQGRIAAETICGRASQFRGTQATAVCGVFGLTVAMTGANAKVLRKTHASVLEEVWLHPAHHVGYYPGAKAMHLKLLFRKDDGRVLGAQAVGEEGVERRIDVIAMAIQLGGTIHDLAEAELCYAPQYGAAKDAVNLAGFIAGNALSGDMPLATWAETGDTNGFILDVREPAECAQGMVPGSVNIPLNDVRSRLHELPTDKPIRVLCAAGQRAYYAVRILRSMGFDARNLSGGWQTYRTLVH
jgi:NADPH-dependent 2,4-dienoyl-CoA reductase/sulfur reductase-like enzyme/rhodanese-related sulfurtransferase